MGSDTKPDGIQIMVVDDHKMFREGLRALLEKETSHRVVGEADNGLAAVSIAEKVQADVVLMDVGMPELNGVDAAQMILSRCPNTKVIAVSMHSDRRFIAGMLQAGASGYLLKDCAFEELHAALETVIAGKIYVSPHVASTIVGDYVEFLETVAGPNKSTLSKQERCVLQLLAEGKGTKDIAQSLHVSIKTIETHRKHIMDKLDIHSIAQLTKYAIREGLTTA